MRLKWKIYLMCISIYLLTLGVTSIFVTENTYAGLLNMEIERALQEEKNMHDSAVLYLIANQKVSEDRVNLKDYGKRIVDMFTSDNAAIELYDLAGSLLETSIKENWSFKRDDLEILKREGKNYVMRRVNSKSYIFINDLIKVDSDELLMSYIKNISEIREQRKQQYLFFLNTGAVGLIFFIVIIEFLSRAITKPMENLGKTAEKIASGNFKERVVIKSEDEISKLGKQFNIMAEEVEKKILELQDETERKQRFIDNLTHELRTPLTSIIGYAELLQKVKDDEAVFNKGLGYIHSEGLRMLKLTNSLMELISQRKGSLGIEKVNIIELLKEIADLIQVKINAKGLKLLIQGESLELNVDKDMMKIVVLNLIDNSIKASSEGNCIIVGCRNDKEETVIYVQDEGSGMEQSELSKITEPFYRVDKSRTRKDGGAGLGLALCKQIVECHGGKLQIESKLGSGTKVIIALKAIFKDGGEIDKRKSN
jgi:signal transduction histidine kinase